jgi:hypothetical protein
VFLCVFDFYIFCSSQSRLYIGFAPFLFAGSLIKSFKAAFLPVFDKLLPSIQRMLDQNAMPAAKKVAIYIFDDVVDYLGPASVPYFPRFVPAMVQCTAAEDPELAQAAAYGLGICAQHGAGQAFAPFVDESAKRLAVGIKHPNARSGLRRTCTDNMVSVRATTTTLHSSFTHFVFVSVSFIHSFIRLWAKLLTSSNGPISCPFGWTLCR